MAWFGSESTAGSSKRNVVRLSYTFLIFAAVGIVAFVLLSGSPGVAARGYNAPAPGATTTTKAPPAPSLAVTQTTPVQSGPVAPGGPFVITFNEPVKPSTVSNLKSSQPGTFTVDGTSAVSFVPSGTLLPSSTLSITANPTSSGGPTSTSGSTLTSKLSETWTIETGSILRIQQVLATLGYLPYNWAPLPGQPAETPLQQLYNPLQGTFTPRYANTPASLLASFQPNVKNHMTTGAMMAFERTHQLPAYGSVRPLFWPALLSGEASGVFNPNGYTYTMVSTALPETITLWNDGNVVLQTPVNTGIPSLATPKGNFVVYLRYPTQTMRGKNVNGSYYVDHGVRWVNYINGSIAIHGFVRATYGTPQSLGCIELPVSQAAIAWKWLHYGSLVNVA